MGGGDAACVGVGYTRFVMLTEWSDPGLVGSLHVRAQRDQLHVGTIYAPCTHHVRTI